MLFFNGTSLGKQPRSKAMMVRLNELWPRRFLPTASSHLCLWHQTSPLHAPPVKLYDVAAADTCTRTHADISMSGGLHRQAWPHPQRWLDGGLRHSATSLWEVLMSADIWDGGSLCCSATLRRDVALVPVSGALRNLKLRWSSGCFKERLCLWSQSASPSWEDGMRALL